MYSLHLICAPDEVDLLSAELWELGTEGIQEIESAASVELIAGFEREQPELLRQFARYQPEWEQHPATDWVAHTHAWWPPREVGARLFLAPAWSEAPTPDGRVRLVHNPGLASGTGEHPCTQLALAALEKTLSPGARVLDVGTGSGILALAALLLGGSLAAGIDTDAEALQTAKENFELNHLEPTLVAGSMDCLRDACADVTVANISGTVLLSIFDDLIRVTNPGGYLILTGFTEGELDTFLQLLPGARVTQLNEWRCVSAQFSSEMF